MADELFEIVIHNIPAEGINEIIAYKLFDAKDIINFDAYDDSKKTNVSFDEVGDLSNFIKNNISSISIFCREIDFKIVKIKEPGIFLKPRTMAGIKLVDVMINFSGREFFSKNFNEDVSKLDYVLKKVIELLKVTGGEKVTFGFDGSYLESEEELKQTTLLELRDLDNLNMDFSKCLNSIYHQLSN